MNLLNYFQFNRITAVIIHMLDCVSDPMLSILYVLPNSSYNHVMSR